LEENGEYDQTTIDAVNRYQVKYSDDILQPWRILKPMEKLFQQWEGISIIDIEK
jgi:hypothetical protein